MKLMVIIPTFGRRETVGRLVGHLNSQHRLPDEVVLCATGPQDVPDAASPAFPVSVLLGPRGSSRQRNAGLDHVLGRCDIVTFLDDDFLPADNYFAALEKSFADNPGWAVIMGHAAVDGVRCGGIEWEDGLAALRRHEPMVPARPRVSDHVGAYGCNMSVRAAAVGPLRFDERLVLYGWQEDIDFTSRLSRHGRVVGLDTLIGVHLGSRGGRVSGLRMGYSQMVNPAYLMRKGSVPPRFAVPLMLRNLLANLIRSVRPEPHVDRRGRLRGNLLGLRHLISGRFEPEYILQIREGA